MPGLPDLNTHHLVSLILLRFLVEVPCWGSLLRFLVEVPCWGFFLRYLVEVPCWGSLLRFLVEVPSWGSFLGFLLGVPPWGSEVPTWGFVFEFLLGVPYLFLGIPSWCSFLGFLEVPCPKRWQWQWAKNSNSTADYLKIELNSNLEKVLISFILSSHQVQNVCQPFVYANRLKIQIHCDCIRRRLNGSQACHSNTLRGVKGLKFGARDLIKTTHNPRRY